MSDERERIERMRAEGKISTEEARRLMDALEKAEQKEQNISSGGIPLVEQQRLSKTAVAGALCLPAAIIVGLLAGFAAHLVSKEDHLTEGTAWIAVLSGTAVLLVGLLLGIAALLAVRREPDKLWGKGFAWVGILQLPVVWFFLFLKLLNHGSEALQSPADELYDKPASGIAQPVPPESRPERTKSIESETNTP